MAENNFSYGGRYYQSANADAQSIKDNFLIRLEEFDIIMSDIRRNPMKGSVQHYLLLGRRGSGKSTLLRRIQVEINEDEALQKKYVPINLAEEQANIYRLFDLLNEIIDELEEKGIEVNRPDEDEDCNAYTRLLFSALHGAIEKSGKKVVLLLDNIDRIFENLHEDQGLVREMLLNFDDIKIIGGSTRMSEHFWKYDEPFYEFFRVLKLEKLSAEETKKLLLHWAEKPGYEELKNFVENRQGQLETVRQLTDGLPRTLQFFVNILINKEQESAYEYMRQIMDVMTPLYQERLNTLPASQRKIVLQMAFLWESVGAGEIADASHMRNNLVSAQLKQLIDKGIAEKVDSAGTKKILYRLSERFFNLWLIFTQGSPKEKRRAKYLTIFMENFYDGDSIRELPQRHLVVLHEKTQSSQRAAMLTKALAQSRFVDSDTRDELIQLTIELPDLTEDIKAHLPPTIASILNEIEALIGEEKWDKAQKIANEIDQDDGVKEATLGLILLSSGERKRAIEQYEKAAEKGMYIIYYELGKLYMAEKDLVKAEKNLKLAVEHVDERAYSILARLYDLQEEYNLAVENYLSAIKKGDNEALPALARLHARHNHDDLAEKYWLMAVGKNVEYSNSNIGLHYFSQKNYDAAEHYFRIAIERKEYESAAMLAFMHYIRGQNKEEARSLIELSKNIRGFENVSILVDVWSGNMSNVIHGIENIILHQGYSLLVSVLENLLYHYQTNMVLMTFENPHYGSRVREHFEPLYYAALVLADVEEKQKLRIPPEMEQTVRAILQKVKEKQEFYYGKK